MDLGVSFHLVFETKFAITITFSVFALVSMMEEAMVTLGHFLA